MKRYTKFFLLLVSSAFFTGINAETLFTDDFQNPADSKSKWLFADSITSTYTNGALTLNNKDSKYMWFATHTMPVKKATFTLTATITLNASSNGVGLACCKNDSSGILFHFGDVQNIYVKKFTPSQQPELLDVTNSFISTATNVMTISKKDSVFTLFCNNNYIGKFTLADPLFSAGGDIGVVLPPKSSAIIDDVVMTDGFLSGATRTCFADNFMDTDIIGWYTYTINGTYQSGGGKFSIANTDAQLSGLLFVNGDFRRSSLKVVTSFQGGKGPYGCMFVYTTPSAQGNKYKTFSFLIDSTQRYGVSVPESSSIKMSVPKTFVHGGAAGAKDTLEILRYDGKFVFIINGTVAESALPIPALVPDAAGLYVGPKTSASFEMFAVGGDSAGAYCPVIASSMNPIKRFAPILRPRENGAVVIDVLGRINTMFGHDYQKAVRSGASGVYFLRSPADAGNHMPVKIVKSLR